MKSICCGVDVRSLLMQFHLRGTFIRSSHDVSTYDIYPACTIIGQLIQSGERKRRMAKQNPYEVRLAFWYEDFPWSTCVIRLFQ